MRVAVVGAGFAGLAAADELARAGAEVRVLEARDRVGGRVHSVPFAGAVMERGAEWVLPAHTTIYGLVERFGLRLVLKGTHYGDREPRGGAPVSRAELDEAVARIRALPHAASGSIEDSLEELGLSPAVHEALRARLDVSAAHPADDLEAAGLAEGGAAFGRFDSHTVEGGNQRIADSLAATLDGALVLSAPVRRIEWSDTGARVTSDGGELEADAVVLALPREPDERPGLRPAAHGSQARGARRAGIRAGRQAVRGPRGAGTSERHAVGAGALLVLHTARAGRAAASHRRLVRRQPSRRIDALDVEQGPERWTAALAELRPDLRLDPEQARS